MSDTTIGSVLKDKFYAANAQGVKLNWRAEDESKTPLTDRQKKDLEAVLDEFFKNLGAVQPLAQVQFDVSNGTYVSLYRYTETEPMTLNLPGMRPSYDGQDSVTFADYIDSLKTAFAVAVKLAEWANKFGMTSCNASLEYDSPSGFDNYMKKLAMFEKDVLPKLMDKYGHHELDIRLSSDARYSFSYSYNEYDNKGRLSVNFTLGDTNAPDFADLIDNTMAENAAHLMEAIDFFLKHEKMGSAMSLDFYDDHLRKYYPEMKKHYMKSIKELVDGLLKDVPEEQLSVDFSFSNRTGFDYYSSGDSKTYRFTLPYVSPRLVLRMQSKDAAKIYASINKAFFNMKDWAKKTGVGRLDFDGKMSDKIGHEEYMNTLLDVLKEFIEDKVEISQRSNMSVSFVSPNGYRPDDNSLSYFRIPFPDCYEDELKDWFADFLSGMNVSG